jgi:DNA-binding transcriptional ArsR family regulator
MKKPRPNKLLIDRADQLDALVSPVRNQIHLHMEILGECTIGQLAESMRREPESLYYHIRRLERVGIVVETEKKWTGGRSEAVYALAGKRIMVDQKQTSPRFLKSMARGIRTLLRYSERCLERSLTNPNTRRGGTGRNFRIEQQVVRLNPADMKEVQLRLDALNEFLTNADDPDLDQYYSITIAISPVDGVESRN